MNGDEFIDVDPEDYQAHVADLEDGPEQEEDAE